MNKTVSGNRSFLAISLSSMIRYKVVHFTSIQETQLSDEQLPLREIIST